MRSMIRDDGYYYDIKKDLLPFLWCIIVYGGRNTGKTYSTLRRAIEQEKIFIFLKRTKEDIKLLCSGGSKKAKDLGVNVDTSPFVSLNRDFGWNIKAFMLEDMGIFCHCDKEGQPVKGKDPVGYIMSLSMVSKYKGFDMSYVDWLIFDEFVPKLWDRKIKTEGESLLELYKTVSRDREHRGKDPLLLICLANSDNAASPVTETLEVTDQIVNMSLKQEGLKIDNDRGILIRRLIDNTAFKEKEKQSKIYKAMQGTKWATMALDNDFGFNDFSQVQSKYNLKRAQPLAKVRYKSTWYYLYINEAGTYIFTKRGFNTTANFYDLNLESDQIRFFYDWIIRLKEAATDHRCIFETYTLSRLVYEYRSYFKLNS